MSCFAFLILSPTTSYSLEFKCSARALMGFGGNDFKLSDENGATRAVAEDLPIACGLIQSEEVIFCLNGPLAKSPAFMSLPDDGFRQMRTDVYNEWVQADQNSTSFFAKFLDGTGDSATGIFVSCKKVQ